LLESLSAYFVLAERLMLDDDAEFAAAWNFSPEPVDLATVADVAQIIVELWRDDARVIDAPSADGLRERPLL
jgi:hypothetical protein